MRPRERETNEQDLFRSRPRSDHRHEPCVGKVGADGGLAVSGRPLRGGLSGATAVVFRPIEWVD